MLCKICRLCSPRIPNEGDKGNLLPIRECFYTFAITALASPHPPRAQISRREEAGSLSRPGKEPPSLQLAAEAQFGGFLINLSCQMLYDKTVKTGGRSGGGGVKVHFAKQTNSKSLDFTNYPSLWLCRPLFFPPHQRMN